MSCSIPQRCARQLLREPFQRGPLPIFLAPAFSPRTQCFSTTSPAQSRVGGAALSIPPEVSFKLIDIPATLSRTRGKDIPKFMAEIKGPKGEMSLNIPSFLTITPDETGQKASLSVLDQTVPHQRAMWGTIRALLQNHILGVSEGHVCVLSMVGVGYRATIEEKASTVQPDYPGQKFVSLKVGFSHPIELGIPQGVVASTPQPTRILLEGVDKRIVTQFAAEIREWRRPEPYKGKGIFVNGETIKLKAKKIK
ncbi:hypothetical protein ACN42_g1209 [Penicillium freii]|uniref:Large ribosomal subunit protein uL6 alpha-beta domain-containing protein n=1 Tax=Penicillium freii TaxID=48697 RepID=A0A101MSD5_PENFR|nr:hypothetical protein N7501_010163 [Penicillium viridicatum]KUM65861.1 hypothetical protein ACN42_g1209 [Penicillium freii]